MRSITILAAAAALSAEAPPPAELQHFQQALAAFHYNEAASVADKVIHARVPSDGKPRPDPLLNAMIGSLLFAAHQVDEAAAYLDHASLTELPPAMRVPTALAHGRVLELRGDRTAALAAYREASAASQNDAQRRKATIGIARELLPQDPSLVREQLLSIANGPAVPERWEARYLIATASSLLGDSAAARQWADGAWADSTAAPLADVAPLKVATLRAGLAATAHDFDAERAMLIASNGLKVTATSSLSGQLPVCGDGGVRPTDYVIFGFVAGPFGTRELFPIAASRPGAVLPFTDRLSGTLPIKEGTGETPLGTVFTVRCVPVVSGYFVAKQVDGDPLTAWAVQQGLYPASVQNDSEDEHLNQVQDEIDSLARRFGQDSPLLIIPRWQLMNMLEARARQGDAVLPGQLADLKSEIVAGLRRSGAPEWLAASLETRTKTEQLAQAAADGSDPTAKAQELFRKQLLQTPFDLGRQVLLAIVKNLHDDWPPQLSQLFLDLNSKVPASLAPRERQAWQLMVANALRSSGKDAEARAAMKAAGLPLDMCSAADSPPKLLEQHFSYNDYPPELIAGEQEGAVLFQFDIAPNGAVANPRIIYSLPSGIFDEASAKGIVTVRYTQPTRGGNQSSCRVVYQPVRWQLESNSDFSVPVLTPQSPGPIT